jgi:hypothetical protein
MLLQKPATQGAAAPSRWTGTPHCHEHHTVQIVVAVDGTVGIHGNHGDWLMAPSVVVRPDVVHSYNGNVAVDAMIIVDPESAVGVRRTAQARSILATSRFAVYVQLRLSRSARIANGHRASGCGPSPKRTTTAWRDGDT